MNAETEDIAADKAEARTLYAARRTSAHNAQTDAASQLADQLSTLQTALPEHIRAGSIIAGFWPYRSEIDCRPLLASCRQAGMITALPVTGEDATPLTFRRFSEKTALISGRFGITEPSETAEMLVPDIILAPLLACDMRGFRLGYGGGFYDRTVASLNASAKKVTIIGAGYDIQLVRHVPVGAFDQPLDGMLTPSRFVQFDKDR